jgi:predicted alpha-1,2-mannosidase
MKNFISGLFFLLIFQNGFSQAEHVDPFIGTGGHGHTHPSATMPFGLVQLGPDTRKTGWDGCSGYHFTDSLLHGFSHTHLSGTGVSDYSDILFKPITDYKRAHPDSLISFKKTNESAGAGYYSVNLDNGIYCEFTSSKRVGVHRYTFPEGERAMIFIDLNYRDQTLSAELNTDGPIMINGHRFSQSWAKNQKLFYSALFSAPFKLVETEHPHAWLLDFGTELESLEVYVALSSTGVEGAAKNLKAEMASFDEVRKRNRDAWNLELSKVKVDGEESDLKIFYTAMYHAFSVPNIWSDVDGTYRGMDDEIHQDAEYDHYTVFSLWDTYRTAHPLYTIVQPERTEAFIQTMLDQFDQSGRLPVWELAANETNCMIGYHSVSVLADAILKGYSADKNAVLRALNATATAPVFGLEDYEKYGFLSIQDESESVSKTLEYAYDDGCIAELAKFYGDTLLYKKYKYRASAYKSVINPSTGLVHPRDNGHFLENTNPREVNSHFTEANAWQYSFAPVHDLKGWLEFLGNGDKEAGRKRLKQNLDGLFSESSETTGRDQADITGLIGQYAHGNEPSHHIAYLYNITETPWKTQEIVNTVIRDFYTDQPDGYIGNEDCGQMSAWYIMSSLGFYPLVPGWPSYMLTLPKWPSAEIHLPNGKKLIIRKEGNGDYINSFSVNGKNYEKNWISHEQLLEGGEWVFEATNEPSEWGSTEFFETSTGLDIAPAPIINVPRRFKDKAKVNIEFPEGSSLVWKSGKDTLNQPTDKFTLNESGNLYARSDRPTGKGHISKASFTKKPNDWIAEITLGTPNSQYEAGGPSALVDGIYGDLDWRKGDWIGIQGQDVEIELSHKKGAMVQGLRLNLLKDIKSWIALPDTVELYKKSGSDYVLHERRVLNNLSLREDESALYSVDFQMAPTELNRLKLKLSNPGILPEWHPGKGGETFIFLDEIKIVE